MAGHTCSTVIDGSKLTVIGIGKPESRENPFEPEIPRQLREELPVKFQIELQVQMKRNS